MPEPIAAAASQLPDLIYAGLMFVVGVSALAADRWRPALARALRVATDVLLVPVLVATIAFLPLIPKLVAGVVLVWITVEYVCRLRLRRRRRPEPALPAPSLGRVVLYRSRTGNYTLAAIVTATRETLWLPGVEQGDVPPITRPDRVHLQVLTPASRVCGSYQEWDVPAAPAHGADVALDEQPPGTWRWPTITGTHHRPVAQHPRDKPRADGGLTFG